MITSLSQVSRSTLTTTPYSWGQRTVPTMSYLVKSFASFWNIIDDGTPLTPTTGWSINGNAIGNNTSFIGSTDNRTFRIKTNNNLAFSIDSMRIARIFSTTIAPTINGQFAYGGGVGSGKQGFVFYSNDATNLSNNSIFTNGSNTLAIYQDHSGHNWLNGNPSIILSADGNQNYEVDQTQQSWFVAATSAPTGNAYIYQWSASAQTGQTASVEHNSFVFNSASTTYSTGALARHRFFRIAQRTVSFVGASVLTDAALVYIESAPIAGTNATINNSNGLLISGMTGTVGLTANTVNGYAISAFAPTGALNNYAARFMGGNVGVATSSPQAGLDVATTMSVGSTFTVNGAMKALSTLSVSNNFTASGTMSVGSTATIAGAFVAASTASIAGNQTLTAHIIANSTAPSSALGAGAGAGATTTLTNCSDIAGTVSITTAGTPAGSNAAIITLTFANAYGTAPHVHLTSKTATTAALGTTTAIFPTTTTTTLIFNAGTVGLTTGTIYAWDYILIQ